MTLNKNLWEKLHIDLTILVSLLLLCTVGLFILYSASNQDLSVVIGQGVRFFIGFALMILLAQIRPDHYKRFAVWLYIFGIALLLMVLVLGAISKGAQRWLSVGLFRFQPAEIMKLALPLMLSWYLAGQTLPPRKRILLVCALLIGLPAALILKQPDLGTALLIASAGIGVILLAGVRWRLIVICLLLFVAATPLMWHHMHDYQRQRVLTFLNPERDPLGAGYHIIQSKIAIGSGGLFGKGWLQGTQSHLQFLPEHATDFIFAVCGEEFGFMGVLFLIIIYSVLIARGFFISLQAQDTFSRLLAGSITLTFFFSMFINIGMVTGILPVVGLPLPLVSYGGTSVITLMAGFGVLMAIYSHRKLVST